MGTLPPEITRAGARKDLETIKQVFDAHGVRVFLTYGALLGIYRDGDFIEYDDDIDLCIIDPISYEQRKRIGWSLSDLGFMPQPISFLLYGHHEPSAPGYNGDDETGIIVCQRNIRVTLFFFKEVDCTDHGREMVCVPLYRGTRLITTPARFFDTPDTIQYKGKTYLTPSPIKEYMVYMYGEDWKKPIRGKHAPQWSTLHPGQNPQT
jgi:hypothetical protein